MSELSMLAQDVTKSTADLGLYQSEFTALQSYITDISGKTFNNVALFATSGGGVTIDSEGTTWAMTGVSMGVAAYTTATSGGGTSLANAAGAASALTNVKAAITQLATDRASVGANISRLNYSVDQLSVLKTNLSAADSRMKDVDVADESTQYARYNILVQSGTAMLAQANTLPQSALKLLGM